MYILSKLKSGLAPQTINLSLNSIKFLYRKVLKDNSNIDIKCVRGNRKLPTVLSRSEIKKNYFNY